MESKIDYEKIEKKAASRKRAASVITYVLLALWAQFYSADYCNRGMVYTS